MPIYVYWGDDDFRLGQAVAELRQQTLDPDWASFNYDRIPPEQSDGVIQALNQAMTPPFGAGGRLVWLADATVLQHCSNAVQQEWERTLPQIPKTNVLLITTPNKLDGRLKITKLLQKLATVQEFATVPPWKTDQILHQTRQAAQAQGVKLSQEGIELLAQAVGNNTRQLYAELEKLRCYAGTRAQPLSAGAVAALVTPTTQSSLQLVGAIRQGNVPLALELVGDLLDRNEPPLRIAATLTGQLRTWLWIKLMMVMGERDDREIAKAAEIPNPKRVYFLQQEIKDISLDQLQQAWPQLLDLEAALKQGAEPRQTLQISAIALCQIFGGRSSSRR